MAGLRVNWVTQMRPMGRVPGIPPLYKSIFKFIEIPSAATQIGFLLQMFVSSPTLVPGRFSP